MNKIGIYAGGGIVAILIFALTIGVSFAVTALITWGIVWAAEGYGYSLPYWPSVVGLWAVLCIINSVKRKEPK